jgi:hypothetical protein
MDQLAGQKIGALRGKDAETNLAILETLAIHGPKTKYAVNSLLGRSREQYPTTFRGIVRLRKRRYVDKVGSIRMQKRKTEKTPTFGVTGRGLLASLASARVCTSVLEVLEKNKHLDLPVPRETLVLARALYDDEQITEITHGLFKAAIETIPYDIETTDDELLVGYVFPILMNAEPLLIKMKPKQPTELLKYPELVEWLQNSIDHQIGRFEKTLESLENAKKWIADLKSGRTRK